MSATDLTVIETSSSDRRLSVVVFFLAFLILVPGVFFGVPFGTTVVGAQSILAGELPYRDFWSMYAPGQFFLTAGIFRVFGEQLWIQGLAVVVLRAVAALLVFRLARRLGVTHGLAFTTSMIVTIFFWQTAPEIRTYPVALPFVLFALLRVVDAAAREGHPRLRRLFVAGLCLGTAAIFKHDIAFHAAVAIGVALLTIRRCTMATVFHSPERDESEVDGELIDDPDEDDSHDDIDIAEDFDRPLVTPTRPDAAAPEVTRLQSLAWFASGALWIVLPVIVATAIWIGGDAWQDLIVFPATDWRDVRTQPFPDIVPTSAVDTWHTFLDDPDRIDVLRRALSESATWVLCWLPIVVFVLGATVVILRRRRLSLPTRMTSVALLTMIPLFWIAAHVQQNTHLTSMAILSLLLIVVALAGLGRLGRVVAGLPLLLAFLLVALAGSVTPILTAWDMTRTWSDSRWLGLPGADWIRVSALDRKNYREICDRILRWTRPDERIYVGLARHDAVVITAPEFHYLTKRRSATRHHELHPAITDREDVQREMIRDLERHDVRCVVLWHFGWAPERLDAIVARRREKIPELGATLLDDYIRERYRSVTWAGEYELLWRRDLRVPDSN